MGNTLGCIAIIVVVVVLLLRRVEVRLVLLTASAALFALAGHLPDVVVSMASELTNLKSVIPICSSMGFAYALRLTECDKHLVHLLLRPLESPLARGLLVPGTIAAGYIVNMAIVSQTGALAVVGSIAVPLLLRKGISRLTAGSLLLLGTSMGGELFNPGAAETSRLSKLTDIAPVVLTNRSIPLNLMGCTAALLVFCWLAARWEKRHAAANAPPASSDGSPEGRARTPSEDSAAVKNEATSGTGAGSHFDDTIRGRNEEAGDPEFRVNLLKAAVPFVPLVLLFAGARLPFLRPFHDHVTILAAMLIGSIVAGLSSPGRLGKLAGAFFDGTGYAYAHIISVTVCATLFGQGIVANGLIQSIMSGLAGKPGGILLASLLMPWALAALSGSGVGAAVSVMGVLIPGAAGMHLHPAQMGILTAMGAHYGRTISPAAAVAILSATLVSPPGASEHDLGSTTLTLTKRVALALCVGGIVMYLAALSGVGR